MNRDFSALFALPYESPSLPQIQKTSELPLESMISTISPQRTKATNSPPCEHPELQTGEPWSAELLLEEKLADLASAEPVVPHGSPAPPMTHPATSEEAFLKGNVSGVPWLIVKRCCFEREKMHHSVFR